MVLPKAGLLMQGILKRDHCNSFCIREVSFGERAHHVFMVFAAKICVIFTDGVLSRVSFKRRTQGMYAHCTADAFTLFLYLKYMYTYHLIS